MLDDKNTKLEMLEKESFDMKKRIIVMEEQLESLEADEII